MILADKIIEERKKNGWSQEELAEKLDVSRQSVSKWEGAQSTPDLQKILKMSELFGVSTDYLLKDEIETTEYVETGDSEKSLRKISMEEANAFLTVNKKTALTTAIGVCLSVLSPICLILFLGMASVDPNMEGPAIAMGMMALLIFVGIAVGLFISGGAKLSKYEYLEKETVETAYGVSGMVKDRKEKYAPKFTAGIITGIILCFIGVMALFFIPLFGEDPVVSVTMVCTLLAFAAAGSFFIVKTCCIQSGFDKLLQEGDYEPEKKKDTLTDAVCTAYWLIATAVFLAWSFLTNDWGITWIVWVVAGVLFPVVCAVTKHITKK